MRSYSGVSFLVSLGANDASLWVLTELVMSDRAYCGRD